MKLKDILRYVHGDSNASNNDHSVGVDIVIGMYKPINGHVHQNPRQNPNDQHAQNGSKYF